MTVGVVAQDTMKSKKGFIILPEAGDFALGFDAVPVLNFGLNAVNIMNNTGQTAQHPGYVSGFNQIIVGKYFLTGNKAIRGRFGINTARTSIKTYGNNPLTPGVANPENILIQTTNNANASYFLAGGIEKRRGHGRLQGFYGGELLLALNASSIRYNYEIAFNEAAQSAGFISVGSSRVLSQNNGTSITAGLRGFAGVEYFVFPKISIGAEFGWGLGFSTAPRGKLEVEIWGVEPGSTATTAFTREVKGNTSARFMGFAVDNGAFNALGASGALSIYFHF